MVAMTFLRALFLAGLVVSPALAADNYSTGWAGGLRSSARLIAAKGDKPQYHAAVEIKLAPSAITYWRNPGDAGLPPTFSFDGSENVASAAALFPAPQRLKENDGEAFGYDHSIILPIDVAPKDPARPVILALKLNYAVCEKICVPAKAELKLPLSGDDGSPYRQAIAEARNAVPRVIDWASLSGAAELTPLDDKTWRLCLAAEAGPARDLFIEAPEQWWFTTAAETSAPAGKTCFKVKLAQTPAGQNLPTTARLTVTGGAGAFETTVSLEPRLAP
jgi:DsbC/DsbD-like thiol-disulfide interchange protein